SANAELKTLGVDSATSAPELLWGIAILYQQMGAAHFSQQIAGNLQRQWLTRWPSGPWLKAWELAYPRPYEKAVSQSAKRYGLSPALLYAVMREESAFDPRAVSKANAYGLMQLLASTARGYSKKVGLPAQAQSLLIPRINIAYGSYVLSQFAAKFPSNSLLAIPGYNAGPASAKRWLKELPSTDFDLWVELIPYRETRDYTKRVLASRAAYAYLYEQGGEEALKLPIQVEN
ncbi:MAG TPA: lytic transglycosylase domain-containing protein, partial [Polyangiaceae bacterium]|nr:lytic transglycosylase domain-containing protein [Polyangiaceae bacterium]